MSPVARTTTRRRILSLAAGGAAALSVAWPGPAPAQAPDKLVIISHAVHQRVATGEKGGDPTKAWREQHGIELEWLTFSVEETNQRVFREASLATGTVDVAFILDRYGGPQVADLFEDLGEWQKRDPIENFDEFPDGMLAAHRHHGKLIAIPYRHATHGLLYNEQLLAEQGITAPPKTWPEMVEIAERMTYTRDDGTPVHGIIGSMDDPSSMIDWIRAYGGEFITPEYEVVIDQLGAVQAVTVLRDLFQKGVLPRNMMSFKTEEVITFMQQGRAAMTNTPFGRYVNFNNPEQSQYPGKFKAVPLPLGADGEPVPAKTSVWAMAIPANAPNKELSWSLIKHLSSVENTIAAAINGNGPARPSAYQDPRVRELVPYADQEAAALENALLVLPGFENTGQAMDILMEEIQAAMLGLKEPEQAMADVKQRVEPLLPR